MIRVVHFASLVSLQFQPRILSFDTAMVRLQLLLLGLMSLVMAFREECQFSWFPIPDYVCDICGIRAYFGTIQCTAYNTTVSKNSSVFTCDV
jgi:hypothetical protein